MPRHRSSARARTRSLLFAPILALGLLVGPGVTGASAHSELLDSDPAEGSTVEQVPEEIRLTFNETPEELGAVLQLTGPDGEIPLTGEPRIEGNELAIDGPDGLTDGDYTLTFRITSADGHPISGELSFAVALAADTATTEEPTTEEPPTEDPTTDGATTDEATTDEATTDEATTEDPTTDGATTDEATTEDPTTDEATSEAVATTDGPAEDTATEEADEGSNLPLIVGIGVLVLAIAGLGVYVAYRSSTRSDDDTDGPGGSAGGEA